MGRHAVSPGSDETIGSSGLGFPGRTALAAAALITVAGAGALIGPQEALAKLPWASGATNCDTRSVDIVVAPEIQSLVDGIVSSVRGDELPDGTCVAAVSYTHLTLPTICSV